MLKFDNSQEQKRTMICRTLSIFIPLFFLKCELFGFDLITH